MSDPINRVQFLRGDLQGRNRPIRPPWALAEPLFVERCSRCDACIEGCEQRILQRGPGGYPQVDFARGHCTFCGECVKACDQTALSFHQDTNRPPWQLSVRIMQTCLSVQGIVCRSCAERCEESAIRFQLQAGGRAKPLLDDVLCSGCGECVSVCPSSSIAIRPVEKIQAA